MDFQHKILHIRRTVQRITSANGNRKTKIVISAPKSATSFRDIAIPESLMKYFRMFRDVADLDAILGGFTGSCIMYGIKRGLYSNEAGMGTAPNAAACADVSHPVKQGLV